MTFVRWVLLALIAITNVYYVSNPAASFVVFLLPVTFALLHSFSYFGKRRTLVIFAIIILISYLAEFWGVHTGRIFGFYHYNPDPSINGWLLGGVPPLVTFSYISMGYVCYVTARVITGQYGRLRQLWALYVPALAAMMMTLWDMAFDPVASYQQQRYIWETGGAYFGVPLHNFAGWFVVTLIFFLLITAYLNLSGNDDEVRPANDFMLEPVLLIAAGILGIVVHGLADGASTLDQAMVLVALFGLGIPVFIAKLQLLKSD